jgi:hypothetical protein
MSVDEQEYPLPPPCPACGCREIVQALAPVGQRERPVFLRCCQCGRERDDLDFYEQGGRVTRAETPNLAAEQGRADSAPTLAPKAGNLIPWKPRRVWGGKYDDLNSLPSARLRPWGQAREGGLPRASKDPAAEYKSLFFSYVTAATQPKMRLASVTRPPPRLFDQHR